MRGEILGPVTEESYQKLVKDASTGRGSDYITSELLIAVTEQFDRDGLFVPAMEVFERLDNELWLPRFDLGIYVFDQDWEKADVRIEAREFFHERLAKVNALDGKFDCIVWLDDL